MRGSWALVAAVSSSLATAPSTPARADAAAPPFEESTSVALRGGIAAVVRSGTGDRGDALAGELEIRRWVAPRRAVSALLAHARFTHLRNEGSATEVNLTLVGARIGFWPHPRFGVGLDAGFGAFRSGNSRRRFADYGQFAGLFADLTVIEHGPTDVTLGMRLVTGPAFVASGMVGVAW